MIQTPLFSINKLNQTDYLHNNSQLIIQYTISVTPSSGPPLPIPVHSATYANEGHRGHGNHPIHAHHVH